MSRKSVLLANLVEDEKYKHAFKLLQGLVGNDFSSLGEFCGSDSDMSSEAVEEVEDDDTDSEELPELCSDCSCGKKIVTKGKKGSKTQVVADCQQNNKHKTQNSCNKSKHKTKEIVVDDNDIYESEDNDDIPSDDECPQLADDNKKGEELTEEEKKRKKNEKKKLQKKKKRDKRKAEKLMKTVGNETNGQNKSMANNNKTNDNNNKTNDKKLEKSAKNESNTNVTKNKQKIETKTATKQKDNKTNDKSDPKSKNKDSDDKSKADSLPNGSVKSSPKSDRESDNIQSDVEEEELLLSSAYVAQIAQRKNKPSVYQKSAQTQPNEAQDYTEDIVVAKHRYLSDNQNFSNNFDNNNSFQINPNNSNINNNQNKSREVDDFQPKYKQFFFSEKQKPMKASAVPLTKEERSQNVDKSVDLAKMANFKAENNLFVEAIDLFSQAIGYNPNDYRFYVNRSYCYDSIQDFRNALKDAEIAIKLNPNWPKCHYRKGKALAGLKNYQESEIALKKVLSLENGCIEAIQDLRQIRYSAILDMGYDSPTAELYSANYDSIQSALNALSSKQDKQKSLNTINGPKSGQNANNLKKANNWWNSANNSKTGQSWEDDDIYISDDEYSIREPTFEETSLVLSHY